MYPANSASVATKRRTIKSKIRACAIRVTFHALTAIRSMEKRVSLSVPRVTHRKLPATFLCKAARTAIIHMRPWQLTSLPLKRPGRYADPVTNNPHSR